MLHKWLDQWPVEACKDWSVLWLINEILNNKCQLHMKQKLKYQWFLFLTSLHVSIWIHLYIQNFVLLFFQAKHKKAPTNINGFHLFSSVSPPSLPDLANSPCASQLYLLVITYNIVFHNLTNFLFYRYFGECVFLNILNYMEKLVKCAWVLMEGRSVSPRPRSIKYKHPV